MLAFDFCQDEIRVTFSGLLIRPRPLMTHDHQQRFSRSYRRSEQKSWSRKRSYSATRTPVADSQRSCRYVTTPWFSTVITVFQVLNICVSLGKKPYDTEAEGPTWQGMVNMFNPNLIALLYGIRLSVSNIWTFFRHREWMRAGYLSFEEN